MRKVAFILVPLAFLVLLLGAVMLRLAGGEEGGPVRGGRGESVVAVQTAPVRTDRIREIRTLSGTLSAPGEFPVASKVSGRLLRLKVDIGDLVERGDVIARLDDEEFVEEVVRAEAELAVARANAEEQESALALAGAELERIRQLRASEITSQADLETAEARRRAAESSLAVARATIAQRESGLRAARLRLSYTRILADWEGEDSTRVVGERFVSEGSNLTANQAIVTLLNLDRLRASVQVTERDYGRIAVGQEGVLRSDAFPGQTFPAVVRRRAPLFQEATRQARIELEVENPEHHLIPGMFVRVSLVLAEREEARVVPREALVRRDGEQGVFTVQREEGEMRARFVVVQPGVVEGPYLELRESPPMETVVVIGQDQLVDGVRVRVANAERGGQEQR